MKWNVFPNYRIPIDYISYSENGQKTVTVIGYVSTPDVQQLKDDMEINIDLVGKGIKYE